MDDKTVGLEHSWFAQFTVYDFKFNRHLVHQGETLSNCPALTTNIQGGHPGDSVAAYNV